MIRPVIILFMCSRPHLIPIRFAQYMLRWRGLITGVKSPSNLPLSTLAERRMNVQETGKSLHL